MTPARRRLTFIGLGFLSLVVASTLALTAFEDNLVFFYSPTDINAVSYTHLTLPTNREV